MKVKSSRIYSGRIPWSYLTNSEEWIWKEFKRQIDIVIGLDIKIENKPFFLPLIIMELKTGSSLSTDELDKKSEIYGLLRETYPWIHTIFLHEDLNIRGLGYDYLFRNTRQFDTILIDWKKESKVLLSKLINFQLEYLLTYWEF